MYSSNQGFAGPRPKTCRNSAYASSMTVEAYAEIRHPDLDDPVLVGLRRHGDRVVRMQEQVTAVVPRQVAIHLRLRRHHRQRLRVRQEGAVGRDRAGQEHPAVLGDAIRDQGRVERLL